MKLSLRPPFLGTLQDTLVHTHGKLYSHRRLIEPTRIYSLLCLSPSSPSLSLLHPPLLLLLLLLLYSSCRSFSTASSCHTTGRYISRTTKLLDGPAISARYPDTWLIIGGLIEFFILACQRAGKALLRRRR